VWRRRQQPNGRQQQVQQRRRRRRQWSGDGQREFETDIAAAHCETVTTNTFWTFGYFWIEMFSFSTAIL
jgi:hypothetical protein